MSAKCFLVGTAKHTSDRTSFEDLPGVTADVIDLGGALSKGGHAIFSEPIQLLDQTKNICHRELEAFLADAGLNDLILIYFSGHGELDLSGSLHLIFTDSEKDFLNSTALSVEDIWKLIKGCRAKQVVTILDCCYSGSAERALFKGGALTSTVNAFEVEEGKYLLMSSAARQLSGFTKSDLSISENERSIFTHFLIEGLTTGEADRNQDGFIDVDEWHEYALLGMRANRANQAPRIAKSGSGGSAIHVARSSKQRRLKPGHGGAMPSYTISIPVGEVSEQFAAHAHYLESLHVFSAWHFVGGKADVTIAALSGGIDAGHAALCDSAISQFSGVDDSIGVPSSHGTATAGLMVGRCHSTGYTGVCPSVNLIAFDVFSEQQGGTTVTDAVVADAIDRSVDAGVDIIFLPIGFADKTLDIDDALDYAAVKNVIVIAAAGNHDAIFYPAIRDDVVCVGDPAWHLTRSGESRKADVLVDCQAILTCEVGSVYKLSSGTSFGAALIAGLVALIRTANKDISTAGVKKLFEESGGPETWNFYEILKRVPRQ